MNLYERRTAINQFIARSADVKPQQSALLNSVKTVYKPRPSPADSKISNRQFMMS
jgi:hypothetical protein